MDEVGLLVRSLEFVWTLGEESGVRMDAVGVLVRSLEFA